MFSSLTTKQRMLKMQADILILPSSLKEVLALVALVFICTFQQVGQWFD